MKEFSLKVSLSQLNLYQRILFVVSIIFASLVVVIFLSKKFVVTYLKTNQQKMNEDKKEESKLGIEEDTLFSNSGSKDLRLFNHSIEGQIKSKTVVACLRWRMTRLTLA